MELILNNEEYKLGSMDVFTQFHVSRRLIPALLAFSAAGEKEDLIDILEPVVMEICKLSDADSSYILDSCLAVVWRKDRASGNWVKIKPLGAAILQYHDIDMAMMLRLVFSVIKENLGGFFEDVPSLMTGQALE